MRAPLVVLLALAAAQPAYAQASSPTDPLSVRAVAFGSFEWFSASRSFDVIFGHSSAPLFGAGVLVTRRGIFIEGTVSYFSEKGERVVSSDEGTFGLNIPLTATLMPIEVSAGYRFRRTSALIPYVGGGVGLYRYKESSETADGGDVVDVDTSHMGLLLVGGTELRVHRWIGLALDVEYTYVPGILGEGGVSKQANETNLGGIAVRVKAFIGR